MISDLHGNAGMAPLIASVTEMSGAQVVLDACDTTVNGTSVEQYCVTTFARAIPSGVDLITAPDNHDSAERPVCRTPRAGRRARSVESDHSGCTRHLRTPATYPPGRSQRHAAPCRCGLRWGVPMALSGSQ